MKKTSTYNSIGYPFIMSYISGALLFRQAKRLFILAPFLVFFHMHCTTDIAGGSQIGNPTTIAGIIVDSAGTPASGTMLRLTPVDFVNNAQNTFSKRRAADKYHTDTIIRGKTYHDGSYFFRDITPGQYSLFGYDSTKKTMIFRNDITIAAENDSIFLGFDTLTLPGVVGVYISDSALVPGALLVVPGTEIAYQTDSIGFYALTAPSRKALDIRYYCPDGDSMISQGPNLFEVETNPNDTTFSIVHVITRPEVSSSKPVGTFLVHYIFSATGTHSTWGHNLEYRFDWGKSDTSVWSPHYTVQHQWSEVDQMFDTVYIRTQARSISDTTVVSEWSAPWRLILSHTVIVTKPNKLHGPLNGTLDSSYTYTTGGSVCNFDIPVEYRFSFGHGLQTSWTTDSTAVLQWGQNGTYPVVASARPKSDAHDIRAYSDTLWVTIE